MKQVRVYGNAREGHRENWKGHYRVVRRDKAGRIRGWRKWSPNKPIIEKDLTKDGVLVDATHEAVKKEINKWEWTKKRVVS